MLAPSQQKDRKIKTNRENRKKSLLDPGRHFPVPYFRFSISSDFKVSFLVFIRFQSFIPRFHPISRPNSYPNNRRRLSDGAPSFFVRYSRIAAANATMPSRV
jgi:hypothetical protein